MTWMMLELVGLIGAGYFAFRVVALFNAALAPVSDFLMSVSG